MNPDKKNERSSMGMVAPPRFELRSKDPESPMIDHYTTGLSIRLDSVIVFNCFCRSVRVFKNRAVRRGPKKHPGCPQIPLRHGNAAV